MKTEKMNCIKNKIADIKENIENTHKKKKTYVKPEMTFVEMSLDEYLKLKGV